MFKMTASHGKSLCIFISKKNGLQGLESTKPQGIIVEDCQGYGVRALGMLFRRHPFSFIPSFRR